ncbi:surface lipoprotein assembly modifier [Antarctobacter sp.]|uniref:surface lipoprotein assembly modifier n=1 Tax=Antarctobacter sp. TaxID=1872577 RepID=UPI003A8E51AB
MRLGACLLRTARWLALAVCAAGLTPLTAQADEVRMSLDEARGAAARALMAGQAELALVLADGVLLGAPGDTQALMMKSRALRALGRPQEAATAARQAFAQSDDERSRFFAALLMAQARSTGGQPGAAQLWLRRAAQIAPDEQLRAAAVRDFRHVRRQTPWRLSLDMSVEPSDNLNGAPKSNSFTFGGLPFVNPSAVPLSGERFVFAADYLRRVPLSETRRLNLGASVEMQRVRFSSAARDKVPGIRNGDYRQDALALSLGYEARAADGSWLGKSDLSLSRHWLGGVPYADAARLDLSYGRMLMPGLTGVARFAYETEVRHDVGLRDNQTREIGVTLTRRFGKAALGLDLQMTDTASGSRLVARESARAAISYGLGKPVKGMLPRVTLAWEVTDYDRGPSSFWVTPRRDAELSVSVNVLLPDFDYYGFAPEIGVSFRDRSSNYTIYETRGTDLRLGLKSVF